MDAAKAVVIRNSQASYSASMDLAISDFVLDLFHLA
jgi:hypothetical protein